MNMVENFLAAAGLVVCIYLLVRLFVGPQRQRRWDNAVRRGWSYVRTRALYVWHWRETRRRAALATAEAIRRAKVRMEREGNVVRPDSFQKPRKPH